MISDEQILEMGKNNSILQVKYTSPSNAYK